ncbi:hypothetical protein DPMN_082747 [Dreissena polymorpha]|uniref:Uncharacterized protein n=1 Tax=Dreissena polymorpha TaxID=45954 RepID=A0A9D4BH31_DREPO|nr:hypothetical protein DPMN_082747 [Dreissena polymorpha]
MFQPTFMNSEHPGGHISLGQSLTKFHEKWTIDVTSRVFKRKNAPPLTRTIFELIQYIIRTNVLTKFEERLDYTCGHFYDNRTIHVASRLLTRKNSPSPGGHVFKPTGTIFELSQDIIGTNL